MAPAAIVVFGSERLAAQVRRLPVGGAAGGVVIVAPHPGWLEPGAGIADAAEAFVAALERAP